MLDDRMRVVHLQHHQLQSSNLPEPKAIEPHSEIENWLERILVNSNKIEE
jgi:hypothetical protein